MYYEDCLDHIQIHLLFHIPGPIIGPIFSSSMENRRLSMVIMGQNYCKYQIWFQIHQNGIFLNIYKNLYINDQSNTVSIQVVFFKLMSYLYFKSTLSLI